MNPNTGAFYDTPESIAEAMARGEELMEVSMSEADKVRAMSRKDRRAWAKRHKTAVPKGTARPFTKGA